MTGYFDPMPNRSMNMRAVLDYVQRQAQTFYKNVTFSGDVTINGFLRTGTDFPYIEIRPDSGTADRPAITLFNPNGDGALIETRDMGGSIEAMLLAGPNAGTGVSELHLRDNGHVWVHSDVAGGLINLRVNDATVMEIQNDEIRLLQPVSVQDEPAYLYKETIYYTSDNTFTKADYPGLRAIRVRMVGGGGAGGGSASTGAGQMSAADGGSAGNYVEAFVLAADIDTTEAVTVGAGGTPGAAGANDGGNGEDSVFDTISGEVRAGGGNGGAGVAASGTVRVGPGTEASATGTGDVVVFGGAGEGGLNVNTANCRGGAGGASHLGGGSGRSGANADGNAPPTGSLGAGGGGSANNASQGTGKQGAAGNDGIVIVDVYV